MHVADRTHIVPLMYEHDRVIEPPLTLKADRVHLITHDESEWTRPSYYDEIRTQLSEAGIELLEHECDMLDLYACLSAVVREITNNEEDDVYVNLATGSKVMTIAGMIACMTTDATPYYVHAGRYGPEDERPPEEPMSHGVAGIEEIPAYPIKKPSTQQIRVLDHLSTEGPLSKKELIEFGESEGLGFLADYESENIKGKYRLLDSRVLTPLDENGYIGFEEVGRFKEVSITGEGENMLRAFKHLIE